MLSLLDTAEATSQHETDKSSHNQRYISKLKYYLKKTFVNDFF